MFHLRCNPSLYYYGYVPVVSNVISTNSMFLCFQKERFSVAKFWYIFQNERILNFLLISFTILGIFKWVIKRQKNQVICGKFPTFSNPKKDPWLRTKRWIIQQACGTGCFGSWKDKMLLGKHSPGLLFYLNSAHFCWHVHFCNIWLDKCLF